MVPEAEVKAIRAGRANIKESYVIIRNEEIFLGGRTSRCSPPPPANVHQDPVRTRKLLSHKKEIARLIGKAWSAGYTLVLDLHCERPRFEAGDRPSRRARNCTTSARDEKKKEPWEREKQRLMRVKV
ncbi:SsrA-binding protein [Thauera humireducens]|uniref:SsrA-binding protein n=1 Tax=Thauera humireducens TaxID=1134435 RepID=UPI00311FE112